MEKLKPCPFCGGKAIVHQKSYGTTSTNSCKLSFVIKCSECESTAAGACGDIAINLNDNGELNIWYDDRPCAVEAWNRRAKDGTV
jgi:hypothetical protein